MTKTSLKNSILSFIIKNRIKKINDYKNHPFQTQSNVLNHLIKKGSTTYFGGEHNFNRIINYENFKKNIPIRSYEELYIYIEKAINGESNILWPGSIKGFAKSSGTTNAESKYIPITKDSLINCHLKGGKDMLSLYQNNFPNKSLYNGKGLMLGGSIDYLKGKKKRGDLSAILLDNFPFWVNYHRIPDIKTAIMSDWEKKLDIITDQAINENITNLTGVPSWMLIVLQRILKKSGKKNILEVWPNLELYMHGGINFDPYKEKFKELIPKHNMNYLEGYNASEGFFAIQESHDSSGLLLMLDHGVFFEFIPMTLYKKGIRNAISLEEVKININYAIVISTNGGLWRYLIGDVIKFTSTNPFRIIITGRTKGYMNIFGEELIIENTDTALSKTCKKLGCKIKDYTVAPIFIEKEAGRHEWLIEFDVLPDNISNFSAELDKNLKKINSDYSAKREKNLILSLPKITPIQNKEFYKWLSKNNRLGGQFKIPRLSNDRKIAEEILSVR